MDGRYTRFGMYPTISEALWLVDCALTDNLLPVGFGTFASLGFSSRFWSSFFFIWTPLGRLSSSVVGLRAVSTWIVR
jgi:hypothetical protein